MSLVEINGIDEAGRIGENILFSRVSVEKDFEAHLLLANLSHFNNLIPHPDIIKGYDAKSQLQYIKELLENESFRITIYKMRTQTQVVLLRLLYGMLSEDLFRLRADILDQFQHKDWSVIQTVLNSLNRFKRKGIFAESFIKAFGIKKITEDIGKNYLRMYGSVEDLSSSGPRIIVQIDGGYPFAFWWKSLLEDPNSGLVKGKCLITGITNGDKYYPTTASAGIISSALHMHPEIHYMFPIKEMEISGIRLEEESMQYFYRQHSYSLSRPIYQNRILFIGKIAQQISCCIPYLYHIQEGRTKTFETFSISSSVDNFLKDFGYGTKDDTNIVVGKLASSLDKENLQYCVDKGYPIRYLSSFQVTFNEMMDRLNSEVQLAPSSSRSDLEKKLSSFNLACQHELG